MSISGATKAIIEVADLLNKNNIGYQFIGEASLFIQDIKTDKPDLIEVSVQWDLMEIVYELFSTYEPSLIQRNNMQGSFHFRLDDIYIDIQCVYNIVVKTDPYRIQIIKEDVSLWCKSAYAYLFYGDKATGYLPFIHEHLQREQNKLSSTNQSAWNQNNYQALLNRFGDPKSAAKKIIQNPEWRLHPFYRYMGNVSGKKIAHLLGSNGNKGVALALLGANVSIVDFSSENKEYASQLAKEAGVSINYIVSDVLHLHTKLDLHTYDIVFMELGVLHYFLDLQPLFQIVKALLKQDGIFILHEFHPISTKLITSSGKKHKVTGNYFNPAIESTNVAFSKHLSTIEQQTLQKALLRKWTMGEVLTSLGTEQLFIQVVEEEPNHKIDDIGIPKTFTIVAKNII